VAEHASLRTGANEHRGHVLCARKAVRNVGSIVTAAQAIARSTAHEHGSA
jgi:hypothetical protein